MTFEYDNQQFKLQQELKEIKQKIKKKEEPKCELCKLEKRTRWIFESKKFVVLECESCHCPMVVFRKHVKKAWPQTHRKMVNHLTRVCDKLYGKGNWRLDTKMSKIRDHVHYHGRPIKK